MTPEEVAAFEKNPNAAAAVRLRRWDDMAKNPHQPTPPLLHFARYLREVALGDSRE